MDFYLLRDCELLNYGRHLGVGMALVDDLRRLLGDGLLYYGIDDTKFCYILLYNRASLQSTTI